MGWPKGKSTWNKGKKLTEKHKMNLSKSHMGLKSWNTGLTKAEDPRLDYIRPTAWTKKDPRISGANQHDYKGGITPIYRKIRNSIEYEEWRTAVFERDLYTCQDCKAVGEYLHADHIKSFAEYPELRFELSNGRTLCVDCHYFRTWGKEIPKNSKWGHRKEIRSGE